MKVALKNVKIHADMSQETTCFSATIYVNGAKIGTVQNSGHGGPNQYNWSDSAKGKELTDWANAQPTEFKFDKLDQLIDALLDNHDNIAA